MDIKCCDNPHAVSDVSFTSFKTAMSVKNNHRACDFFQIFILHLINSDTTIHGIYRRKQNRTIHILCKN
jgi:hypothetical protein